MDELQAANINALFFQVRPECDAIYQSNFEPWSYWLSGEQGTAPDPFYDPLQFAIDEAHKRGMELHAWFNPFRAVADTSKYLTAPDHISNTHNDWIIQINTYKFLNPGLPEVRDYSIKVILDVVENYEIDGVHMDDYFYPYPGNQISEQDTATFRKYPRGFSDIGDWRRDNVNLFVKSLKDSIRTVKPYLKYGISPFGIWKNGVPAGITGLDAYNVIFCDALSWMENQWLDYLIPQLYWPFGGSQDYGTLLPWWAARANGRHLYSGMGYYKNYSYSEYSRQLQLNRDNPDCAGSVFYKATDFINNKSVAQQLAENDFHFKALVPSMDWKDNTTPGIPVNVRYESLADERGDGLTWDVPVSAKNGEVPFMYAVYKLDTLTWTQNDLDNPKNIAAITGTNYAQLLKGDSVQSTFYFGVTSLSRNYMESGLSSVIEVNIVPPGKTLLAEPANNAPDQSEEIILKWYGTPHSNLNRLQISTDSLFSEMFFEKEGIKDTFRVINGFTGQTKYFWRVSASNFAGEGDFSETWSFKTGFPLPPVLSEPAHTQTGVSTHPVYRWHPAESATSYHLQVSFGATFSTDLIKIDTVLADTFCTPQFILQNDRIYTWRVSSENNLGFGGWSDEFKFKTTDGTGIEEDQEKTPWKFQLSQNYPNPFNPTTAISYQLSAVSQVKLKVYNMLGQRVRTLVNEKQEAGKHTVVFDATGLASGVYFYRLSTDNGYIQTKKMILLY